MTNIVVDTADAGGGTNPGDEVVFFAPEVRPGAGNTVIHGRTWAVKLTNGKTTVSNVAPGPLVIRVIPASLSI